MSYGSVISPKNRNRSIGAWLKSYELRSKGTGRRPSVGDPVDSIGIASPGIINCDKHNGKGIMRCRLLSQSSDASNIVWEGSVGRLGSILTKLPAKIGIRRR